MLFDFEYDELDIDQALELEMYSEEFSEYILQSRIREEDEIEDAIRVW